MRGFDADIIIVDEAFFIKPNTLFTVIFPVLQQTNTCLICTTTPGKPEHALTKIIDTRDDDGEFIFNTVRIGKPCDACEKEKVLCTHAANTQPEGTSRAKRSRYMKFYENGLEDLAMQEYMGVFMNKNTRIFEQPWIEALRNRKRVKLKEDVPFLMMTMDPAQGGANEWATMVFYYDKRKGRMVILFMDAARTEPNAGSIKNRLEKIIQTVRDIQTDDNKTPFKYIPIVIACESAPKLFSGFIAEAVAIISKKNPGLAGSICVMSETSDNRAGVYKNALNTREMAHMAGEIMRNNLVYISDKFRTLDLVISEKNMLDKFYNTLPFMERKQIMKLDGSSKAVITGKGPGCPNDDITVAFMMGPYWYDAFMVSNKPEYQKYKSMVVDSTFKFDIPKHCDEPFYAGKAEIELLAPRKRARFEIGCF